MNFIDFILFIILLACVLVAVRRGFVLATLQLLTWLGSLVIAFTGYNPFSRPGRTTIPIVWICL